MHQSIKFQLELGGQIIAIIQTTAYETFNMSGDIVEQYDLDKYRPYLERHEDDDWIDSDQGSQLFKEIHSKGYFEMVNTQTNERIKCVQFTLDGNSVSFRC